MRAYERPTLTAAGSFRATGLGLFRGRERILPLRFSF
ncbi:keywimysin-related RiPP [Streptomyces sp. NPDC049627]